MDRIRTIGLMRELSPERAIRISIASIIRTLLTTTAVCALAASASLFFGLAEVAVPFALAAVIGLGLTIVSVAWLALTRAHPSTTNQ